MLAGLQRMQTTGNVGMRHEQDMQPGAGGSGAQAVCKINWN